MAIHWYLQWHGWHAPAICGAPTVMKTADRTKVDCVRCLKLMVSADGATLRLLAVARDAVANPGDGK